MAKLMTRRVLVAQLLGTMGLASYVLAPAKRVKAAPLETANSGTTAVSGTGETLNLILYSDPNCGCCGKWAKHMEAAGFTVQNTKTEAIAAVKEQYNVPPGLASCHTAIAGEYVIEGHVPAEDVQRLLAEKPAVAGIAVPGMPLGSPGMEDGDQRDPYQVVSFTYSGDRAVFAEYS